jgi:hypothetical protein
MLTQKYRRLTEDAFDATTLGIDNFTFEWTNADHGEILCVTWRADTKYCWRLLKKQLGISMWLTHATPGELFVGDPRSDAFATLEDVLKKSVPMWVGCIVEDMRTGKAYVSAIESLRTDFLKSLEESDERAFLTSTESGEINARLDELVARMNEAAASNDELAKQVALLEEELKAVRGLFETMPRNTALRAAFSKLGKGLAKLWESKEIRELAVEKLKQIGNSSVGS